MLKIKLPKNRIQYLIDELERRVKAAVLERGWEYFHRGLVHNVTLVQGCLLQADVRGKSSVYRTTLDLEQFDRSECDCAYDGCCKHMAALVLSAYSVHGRPELLFMQLKKSILQRRKPGKSSRDDRMQEALELSPKGTPKDWFRFFEQKFHGFSLTNQHSVEQFHQAVWDTLGDKASAWPASLGDLYQLHLTLFVLHKIDQFHQENQSSYLSFYIENGCKLVAGRSWEQLRDLGTTERIRAMQREHPVQWKATLDILGETVTRNKPGPVRWLDVYRYLWSAMLPQGDAAGEVVKEEKRLGLLFKQQNLLPRMRDGLLLARAHFQFLRGEDHEAMEGLEQLTARQFADFELPLSLLAEQGDWDRLLRWLRWLLPVLAKAKQEEFNKGCGYWVEAIKHQVSDEEWIRVMLSLLPRSYYYYTDYLMQTGRYRQWVDLQLTTGVTPANLYQAELRTVEGHDPELLLPLYHQSVDKAIQEKNRDSYKLATKHLAKLHSLYAKANRLDRWEEYMERLSAKYARLRAFKEELGKGKWMS